MNYRSILPNLEFRGLVKAVKRDYYVLEAQKHFMVVSPKDDATGNYTFVPKKAVDFITKKLGGTKSITTSEVLQKCKGSMYFPDSFSVLNALYAMTGSKRGSISKISGQKLFFNVWKKTN